MSVLFKLTSEQKLFRLEGANLLAPLVADATNQVALATAQVALAQAARTGAEIARDAIPQGLSVNTGTRLLHAFTDTRGDAVAGIMNDGDVVSSAWSGGLTEHLTDFDLSPGDAAHAFADSDGVVGMGIDRNYRLFDADGRYPIERAASNHASLAAVYESFGDTTKSRYFHDKARSGMAFPIGVKKTVVRWNESANTNFVRMSQPLPFDNATGLIFFSQRRDVTGPDQTGENGQRLCCRSYTIVYQNGEPVDIVFGSIVVISQPAGTNNDWTLGRGKHISPSAWITRAGQPNAGRINVIFMVLESNDGLQGTTNNSKYHLYKTFSDDLGATWSTPAKLFDASAAYTSLGIAAPATGTTGWATASGNSIIRIPFGTYANRLIIAASILSGSTRWYEGCIYSDDDGITWTIGSYTQTGTALALINEINITFTMNGDVVLYGRSEQGIDIAPYDFTRGRQVLRSTNGGQTFTDLGYNTGPGLNNVAAAVLCTSYAPANGFSKVIVGGATNPNARVDQRRAHRMFLSYDNGATFPASTTLFEDAEGIGYSSLIRLSNGVYMMTHDIHSADFNVQTSIGVVVFNEAFLFARSTLT